MAPLMHCRFDLTIKIGRLRASKRTSTRGRRHMPLGRCLTVSRIVVSLVTLALGAASVVVEARECPAVVVGTNDPATDVLNVQQAVDRCATVLLQGSFSFAGMSTGDPLRVITLGRSVNIVGQFDDQGHMP